MTASQQWTTTRLLTTAARLAEHARNKQLIDSGVTHSRINTLQALTASGPTSQAELALSFRVQTQTIGKILVRLEQLSLVSRTPSSTDRWTIIVHIGTQGRALLEQVDQAEKISTRNPGWRPRPCARR